MHRYCAGWRLFREVVVSEGEQRVGWEKGNIMSPPLHPLPLILQQATGQVSRHWLHLLHLGCLAFFSSPKWSCKFHVAGRVTDWEMGASKWEIRRDPGTTKPHNGLCPTDTGPACQLSPSIWND